MLLQAGSVNPPSAEPEMPPLLTTSSSEIKNPARNSPMREELMATKEHQETQRKVMEWERGIHSAGALDSQGRRTISGVPRGDRKSKRTEVGAPCRPLFGFSLLRNRPICSQAARIFRKRVEPRNTRNTWKSDHRPASFPRIPRIPRLLFPVLRLRLAALRSLRLNDPGSWQSKNQSGQVCAILRLPPCA